MTREYRFSLTPRLIALALFCGIALMVLLFALGYQVGLKMAAPDAVPGKLEQAAGRAERQALQQFDKAAASAAKAAQKALP